MRRDVGKRKVDVQAHYLRQVNPLLEVCAIADLVQNVPRGLLRAEAIISCLDSRYARCVVNELAWRLKVPWIDCAVDAGEWLAHVNVYVPAPGAPCLECAWAQRDYAALEQTYACQQGTPGPAPTRAPASLGAIAAGLAAVECQKLLAGDWEHVACGHQVLWNGRHHQSFVTHFDVNPGCRFDHASWRVEPLPMEPTRTALGQLYQQVVGGRPAAGATLQLGGHKFVRRLHCSKCHFVVSACLYLSRAIPLPRRQCPACGTTMDVPGFHLHDRLDLGQLSRADRRRSLRSIGFRQGDIITLATPRGERHLELAAVRSSPAAHTAVSSHPNLSAACEGECRGNPHGS